ncbi:MAG: lytic transglycosylase domain-containing protein [Pararhodobacter sp.]|nr:lytic transglycosylase domain-containing protein [Pararhodobacter sp.]
MKNSRLWSALLALMLFPPPATAGPQLCEAAARRAAAETGVPADVLLAIALTETGRMQGGVMRPWPWAANRDGQGLWFDTPAQALDFATRSLADGRTGFDLGCFQINWHWHGAHFASPRALLDPLEGARYAARFLTRLREEFGSWAAAAGAYHSRTPQLAARYRARFERLRAGLSSAVPSPAVPSPAPAPLPRVNTFPLLVATNQTADQNAGQHITQPGSLQPAAAPPPRSGHGAVASLVPSPATGGPAFLPALHEARP